MNRGYVDALQEGIGERAEMMRRKFREQFAGMGPAVRDTRGDREFLAWWLVQLQKWGPDFAMALEYVEGGKDVLRREREIRERVGTAGMVDILMGREVV